MNPIEMALIGARERRDMADVETDMEKKLKGKKVISIEVQSLNHVQLFYEDEVLDVKGRKTKVILCHDAYGKRDTTLNKFAQMYDRSWSGTVDASGSFHNFGDGLIYASLRGPGGGKYVNISFVLQNSLCCKMEGKNVLQLKNGHEVPLCKDMTKNQEKLKAAMELLHQKFLEIQDVDRQMQGEEVPLIDAMPPVSVCPPDEQVAMQEKEIEGKGVVGHAAGGSLVSSHKNKERISSARNRAVKLKRMRDELIDSVSLTESQVADLDKIPSVEMRRMVERTQKEEILQSISRQMMCFFARLV